MNITEYSRHWYTTRENQWRPNTRHGYYNLIEHHIVPWMNQLPLSELTEGEIQNFYGRLAEDGLSDRSIWCVHLLLRRILGEACRKGLLDINPASNIQIEPSEPRTFAPIPKRQLRQYLAEAEKLGAYPVFYMGLASGLRQGELITLSWAAFDLDHHRLILPRTWVKLTEQMETILKQEQERHPDSSTIFQDPRTGQPYTPSRLYYLHNQILPRLGKWELNELTNGRIRRFYTQCRNTGNHRTNQPLSDVTMRHIMILLRKILRQAMTDGLLETEPMAGWSFHETKGGKAEPLTRQEVADYLDAAGLLGCSAMFTLAVRYGLRQRELIALKWSDVDMEKPSLTVHAGRVVKEGRLVEYAGKVRELQLSPEDAALLKQEHAKHPSSEVLFIHPGTLTPYTPNMVRLRHKWILEKAEIPHIRFEDLRHTCAVLAMQNGMTAAELTHLQGRCRTTQTRQSYAEYMNQASKKQVQKAVSEQQYLKEEQQQAVQVLDGLLGF